MELAVAQQAPSEWQPTPSISIAASDTISLRWSRLNMEKSARMQTGFWLSLLGSSPLLGLRPVWLWQAPLFLSVHLVGQSGVCVDGQDGCPGWKVVADNIHYKGPCAVRPYIHCDWGKRPSDAIRELTYSIVGKGMPLPYRHSASVLLQPYAWSSASWG